jgi:hypothetical protein
MSTYPTDEIGHLPSIASFGSTFSYAAWTPGTTVTLCNVPWNNDYRDIVHYASKTDLNTYLDNNAGPKISIDKMTQCRVGMPIRLNIPFGQVFTFNYLRVVNNPQPVTGHGDGYGISEATAQTLYYFVTDVRYLAPNTTEIYVQLDVWQTFCHEITFGNCYIERGHIGIANENNFQNNGRDYLTIPEGFDIGNEYVVQKTYDYTFVDNRDTSTANAIMVMSTTSLFGPYGTVDKPVLTMAQGSAYGNVPNGCDLYLFASMADFQAFMKFMADKPWVTQGIVSVTAVSYGATVNANVVTESLSWTTGSPPFLRLISGPSGQVNNVIVSELDPNENLRDRVWLAQNWRDGLLTGRYANLKKFLTYPYTAVELTTYSATPLVLKPECMVGNDIVVLQKAFMGQPNPRIVFIPYKYNALPGFVDVAAADGSIMNDGGEMYDMMTGIFELPTFSVVNNGYLSYMAANRNSIAFQHSSADWSQQRALRGAETALGNTARGIDLGVDLAGSASQTITDSANLARTVAGQRALLGGANAVAGGVMRGAAGGGPAGAAAGAGLGILNQAADLAIAQNQIEQSAAIASGQVNRNATLTKNTGIQNMDTNFAYAQFSAQGDYSNAIAGINAKVQDARLIQPTTAGQLGGDVFNLAMLKWGLFAKVKMLQYAVNVGIGEFWLRYGYAINRFGRMPSDFQVMEKFTYWKLRETYITSSSCPETYRQTIRGIFEKGVTVWANAADIGNIDMADNAPKTGITL